MRYCPYCQRINVGRPQICNYCGRTWHLKLCPRGHENPLDVQFCGECGSTDLSEPAGSRTWWNYFPRIFIWGMLLLFIVSVGNNIDQILPQFLILILPIVILVLGCSLIVAIAPRPLKGLITSLNRRLINLASVGSAGLWNIIKRILFN